MGTPIPSSATAASTVAKVDEFVIRVPKNLKKKHHVMRFNATLNVDFAQWKMVKMERENNMKDFRGMDDDTPKFGAGSEYNRELKEEVRRKKFGIISRKYKAEAQPWILKVGGKSGKKFRGIREGGVGENAAFYVFTHATDGAIEAYPLNEWYNFQPIQRYKSLSAEEAEQEFGRRKKVMNYFSLMLRKRLKGDDAEDGEDPEEKKATNKKGKELKISDMDEWIESEDESDSDEDEEKKKEDEESDQEKGKKKGKKDDPKKKKKRNVDDEAFEESDDGDEEGRELDYISDSSDSDSDHEGQIDKDMKGVAEEDALRKLLTSDEESDTDEKKSGEESEKDEEDNKNKKEANKDKDMKDTKDKKNKKKTKKKSSKEDKESSSELSSDSSDSEADTKKPNNKKKEKDNVSAGNSRSASPSMALLESNKRKAASLPSDLTTPDNSNSPVSTPAKKPKLDTPSLPATFAGVVNANNKEDYGITEEAVRRYLMRKPMTTRELLTKFKNKRTGVSSEKLVETMTQILKKINPVKQTIQGKMYLSIKVNK